MKKVKELKIDPNEYYSARQVHQSRLLPLPWKSMMTLITYLNTDRGKEVLRPVIKQLATNKRYYIKGSTIIEMRRKAEMGELEV